MMPSLPPNHALAALMIVMALSSSALVSAIKTQSTKSTLGPIKLFFQSALAASTLGQVH
jgi:hypothetical protein